MKIAVGQIIKIPPIRPAIGKVMTQYMWIPQMDKYMGHTAAVLSKHKGVYARLSIDGGTHYWHQGWLMPSDGEEPDIKWSEKEG